MRPSVLNVASRDPPRQNQPPSQNPPQETAFAQNNLKHIDSQELENVVRRIT